MEKLGGQPIDVERSLLQPDDVVVVPEIGIIITLPPTSVGWVGQLQYAPSSWMNLESGTDRGVAGFYSANFGPVPFAIGKPPQRDYDIVKVFSRLQFNWQLTNPRAVQAGDVPSFSNTSDSIKGNLNFPVNSEEMTQVQLAVRYENEGKIEEAIQHYRQALAVDSNNPAALNNLAGILATASRPELRNGEEAVQLATKAVELTDCRMPLIIDTLAAAYAETGQFSKAVEMAQIARALAFVTGQNEIAAKNAKLLTLYSSGKAVGATPVP
jgi:tetratricopeptide (TPR) repeat protein